MKKNLLGALVIFFVTFACILAINEATNTSSDEEIQKYYSISNSK